MHAHGTAFVRWGPWGGGLFVVLPPEGCCAEMAAASCNRKMELCASTAARAVVLVRRFSSSPKFSLTWVPLIVFCRWTRMT